MTDRVVDVGGLWLYRVANQKVDRVRVLDSAHEAFLFGLAMMLHGCNEHESAQQVIALGWVVLRPAPETGGPWSASETWLDIGETRSWLDVAREDRWLRN